MGKCYRASAWKLALWKSDVQELLGPGLWQAHRLGDWIQNEAMFLPTRIHRLTAPVWDSGILEERGDCESKQVQSMLLIHQEITTAWPRAPARSGLMNPAPQLAFFVISFSAEYRSFLWASCKSESWIQWLKSHPDGSGELCCQECRIRDGVGGG